ncbi:sigma-70 family RNA polymerase sigma factor [Bacillus sp. REN10]|uniref:sigma-70 family RNA polymerase sigma factor n=1 Tax=Bacillus sp. REN10 TaxID=2782541 RepID=UPI0031B61BFC
MENFENIYHQFSPMIRHIMRSLHIYKDEDEFQQIGRIALWEAYEKYEPQKGAFSTIAYSYIKGRMMDALKKAKQLEEQVVYTDQLLWQDVPDQQKDQSLELEMLLTYTLSLSDREKVWLIRTFYENMTIAEIATCENVSPSAVKKWRKQALAKLKLQLIRK